MAQFSMLFSIYHASYFSRSSCHVHNSDISISETTDILARNVNISISFININISNPLHHSFFIEFLSLLQTTRWVTCAFRYIIGLASCIHTRQIIIERIDKRTNVRSYIYIYLRRVIVAAFSIRVNSDIQIEDCVARLCNNQLHWCTFSNPRLNTTRYSVPRNDLQADGLYVSIFKRRNVRVGMRVCVRVRIDPRKIPLNCQFYVLNCRGGQCVAK